MIDLIKIGYDAEGIFKNRPNKYLAEVDIIKPIMMENELVHVHDPGRLTELLFAGNKVSLKKATNPDRKTKWDIISAYKEEENILINSAYHRKISEAILGNFLVSPIGKIKGFKAEVKYNESRIDFLATDEQDNEIWIETKGCTLAENGTARFPDAPTLRGQRHLHELIELKSKGKRAVVFLLVLANAENFEPNRKTDPDFATIFYKAIEAGVEIFPIALCFDQGIIKFKGILPIKKNSLLD